jgi:hypothetical protein
VVGAVRFKGRVAIFLTANFAEDKRRKAAGKAAADPWC